MEENTFNIISIFMPNIGYTTSIQLLYLSLLHNYHQTIYLWTIWFSAANPRTLLPCGSMIEHRIRLSTYMLPFQSWNYVADIGDTSPPAGFTFLTQFRKHIRYNISPSLCTILSVAMLKSASIHVSLLLWQL